MSKEIFEKNLKAMEKWYPTFADMIRKKQETEDDIEVIVEQSWDGETIFRIKKEEQMLYLSGKRNAEEPVKMWLEHMGKVQKYAPVFLFGLGNGAYLKALINNTEKEVNVVVYEPSVNIFLTMLQEIDLAKEIENRPIGFIIEELNVEEFAGVMDKVLVYENRSFLKKEIHPNYNLWYAEKIMEKVKLLHHKLELMMINQNTGEKFSTHLAMNVLNNMKYICEGYHTKALSEAMPDRRVAILVSAGPSLNKNIQELKKAKNKAFILAVDTALKPLLKAGIKPDAFFTIDAQKPLELIEAEGVESIPVIAPTCASQAVMEHQKGKHIFFHDDYDIPYFVYQVNGLEFPRVTMGGSVACSAFSLLYKMGFETVILVGQDLAYSDNKSHADGTLQEKMPEEDTQDMIMVKGNYTDKVPTLVVFRLFIYWFNDYIKGAKEHREFRVVNATEGGAYIEGTELAFLKDAIEELCGQEVNYEASIERMQSAFSPEQRKTAIEYLHKIPGEYKAIKENAELLQKMYKKLDKLVDSGNMEQGNANKLLKKIKKLSKKCSEGSGYQLIVMTMSVAEHIIRNEYFYEKDTQEEDIKEIARKGILYSKLLQECAALLQEMAEEALLPIE